METEFIAWGLTLVLGILSAVFGTKIKSITKEVFDVFKAMEEALEDGKITKEELLRVMEESKEALLAIKGIFKRKQAE